MSRGAATFKQSDLVRALRAANKAGVRVERIELEKSGRIVVVTAPDRVLTEPKQAADKNEWDDVK
jgi:hypothetical protein